MEHNPAKEGIPFIEINNPASKDTATFKHDLLQGSYHIQETIKIQLAQIGKMVKNNLPPYGALSIDTEASPEMVYLCQSGKIINRKLVGGWGGSYSIDFRRNSKTRIWNRIERIWIFYCNTDSYEVAIAILEHVKKNLEIEFPKNKFPNKEIRIVENKTKVREWYPFKDTDLSKSGNTEFLILNWNGVTQLIPKAEAKRKKIDVTEFDNCIVLKRVQI